MSQVAPVSITNVAKNSTAAQEAKKTTTQPEIKKDGDKKLKLALAGLGAVGVATAAGIAIYKGHTNKITQTAQDFFNKPFENALSNKSVQESGDFFESSDKEIKSFADNCMELRKEMEKFDEEESMDWENAKELFRKGGDFLTNFSNLANNFSSINSFAEYIKYAPLDQETKELFDSVLPKISLLTL